MNKISTRQEFSPPRVLIGIFEYRVKSRKDAVMRAISTRPAWRGNPIVLLPSTGQKQKTKSQRSISKNKQVPHYQGKALSDDEKWVLEALYKRLPTF